MKILFGDGYTINATPSFEAKVLELASRTVQSQLVQGGPGETIDKLLALKRAISLSMQSLDERKGLPRPPIQDAETVNVVMTSAFRKVCSCGRKDVIHVTGGSFKADDPRVKQLERRVQNLGRQARK